MMEFITLVFLVVSPALAVDQAHKGNLVASAPACAIEYTKSAGGNYSYATGYVIKGGCEIQTDHS